MTTDASWQRSKRGFDLATAKHRHFRRVEEDVWIVPSATCSHHCYVVDASRGTCTCPDFEESNTACKHLWAVRYFENEISLLDGTHLAPPPVTGEDECTVTLYGGSGS